MNRVVCRLMLFASTVSLSEVVTGAVLGAVSAAETVLLNKVAGPHFALGVSDPGGDRDVGDLPAWTDEERALRFV